MSAAVDVLNAASLSAFGNTSGATTLTVQHSQDGSNWYDGLAGAVSGDFHFYLLSASRFVRLKSSANVTAAATVAAKEDAARGASHPLYGNPLAYFAGSNLNDSTVNARHLTDVNVVTFPAGKVGNGLGFASASSQHAKRTDAAFAITATSLSFTVWVKLASKSGNMAILDRLQDASGYALFYDVGSDTYQFWIGDGTVLAAIAGTAGFPAIGAWQHLGAIFDTTTNTLRLFENGVSVGTQNQPCGNPADPGGFFALGASAQGTVSFLNGTLDEVACYDRDIGAAGVAYHYAVGAGRTWPLT